MYKSLALIAAGVVVLISSTGVLQPRQTAAQVVYTKRPVDKETPDGRRMEPEPTRAVITGTPVDRGEWVRKRPTITYAPTPGEYRHVRLSRPQRDQNGRLDARLLI